MIYRIGLFTMTTSELEKRSTPLLSDRLSVIQKVVHHLGWFLAVGVRRVYEEFCMTGLLAGKISFGISSLQVKVRAGIHHNACVPSSESLS